MKLNFKKTKSLRLGINEGEKVMLGKEKIEHVDSYNKLGNIISENGIKSRIAKSQHTVTLLKKKKTLED